MKKVDKTQSSKNVITNDEEAIKLFQIAQMKDEKGDVDGCLEDTLLFFEYAEKTGNNIWASTASQNIGIAYNTIGAHEEAAKYHLKHLELARALGDVKGQKEANVNIGLCEQLILGATPILVSRDINLVEIKKNKVLNRQPSLATTQVVHKGTNELSTKERRMSAILSLNAKKQELSKKERRMSAIRALNAKKQELSKKERRMSAIRALNAKKQAARRNSTLKTEKNASK